MDSIARVLLVGGGSKAVRYDDETTVERVLQVVVAGVGISEVAAPHFALRLVTHLPPGTAADSIWLHPNLLMTNIRHIYQKFLGHSPTQEIRLDLRMRFIPQSAYELLLTESNAFFYLHEQVFEDFLGQVAWKVSTESALELAALKVCRDQLEKQVKHCLDGRFDVDNAEAEAAMQRLVPNTVLLNPNNKPSHLKKHFISLIRKYSSLAPTESVLRSLSILVDIVKFDVEVFSASLGSGWNSPVDLLIGPEVSISYRTDERCEISRLCELRSVLEIRLKKMEYGSEKTIVTMKLSGTASPTLITVATWEIADSLAHLIDGYQVMYNQGESVYKMKGVERCESVDMHRAPVIQPRQPALGHDLRVKREFVTLKKLIGGGQFGNVYKGLLSDPRGSPVTVAVKVCKADNEPADTQLILQESHLMKELQHDHIISLIGVCVDAPIWLIMELAPLGELRQYLQANKSSLDLAILLLYCKQISLAIHYLHSRKFVHRDIAARNVLVSSTSCVKLTDFGLSRALDYDTVYTASRGKLPIKWLAPESINYREFSMASDVWMYGICVWEILSWGVKPWQGVANVDVVTKIEAGQRPLQPESCPISLYNYLERKVWALEPSRRPILDEIVQIMDSVHRQIQNRVHPDNVRVDVTIKPVPVILTSMSALPNLTLWRTIEEQRRQAEEDSKWLEEEEETGYPDEPVVNGIEKMRIQNQTSTGTTESESLLSLSELTNSTRAVVEAVEKLNSTYCNNMKHDDFVLHIRDITGKLREMFADSTTLLQRMDDDKRHEVERVESLIANDMRQMTHTMKTLVEHGTQQQYNASRRDIIRTARDLEINVSLLTNVLRDVGKPAPMFRAVLSDC